MRTLKWNAFLSGLCACALMVGIAGSARADVTVEKGSSVVTFPYIESSYEHGVQTYIQLTNTGNNMLHVACYYVRTVDHYKPVWEETDFDIWLTKQQPTVWPVGHGRRYDYTDQFQGFDVSVPPMGEFVGELKCFEISPTGEPLTGNHLKGEATIITCDEVDEVKYSANSEVMLRRLCEAPHDVTKYNAIGVEGIPDAQGTNPLQLDGQTYAACPEQNIVNFIADGAATMLGTFDNSSAVEAESLSYLTLVPCTEDFENQQPTKSTVQFLIYNEYEQRFSASTTVDCWFDSALSDIDSPTARENSVFSKWVLGSDVGTAWLTPVGGDSAQPVIGLLSRQLSTIGSGPRLGDSYATTNLHTSGNLPAQITLTAHD